MPPRPPRPTVPGPSDGPYTSTRSRKAARPLPSLPVELHLSILESGLSAASFASFSERATMLGTYALVSPSFRHWAQAELLTHVVICHSRHGDRLLNLLQARPELARHVRTVRIGSKPSSDGIQFAAISHFLRCLLDQCKPKELKIRRLLEHVQLFELLQQGPSLEAISISDTCVCIAAEPPASLVTSSLRRLYLSEINFLSARGRSSVTSAARLFSTLATLPALSSLAVTYPFLDGDPMSEIASLIPFAPLLPTLTSISSTTPALDRRFADARVQFFDCFADIVHPSTACWLPQSLAILRLNDLAGENAMPDQLVVALDRVGLPRLRELWIPVEWDEVVLVEKWCKGRGVVLVRESFEHLDEEGRVFDEPWEKVVSRVERLQLEEN